MRCKGGDHGHVTFCYLVAPPPAPAAAAAFVTPRTCIVPQMSGIYLATPR